MDTYIANPINNSRGRERSGALIEPALYGWHQQSPVMQAGGSITFERKAKDDNRVYFNGTLATTIVSKDGHYYYPIKAKMFVGNSLIGSYTIKENNVHAVTGTRLSININGSFQLSNNADDVTVHYYCCYGLREGSCGSAYPSPDSITFRLPAGKLKYLPYTKPAIKISSESTKISRYDGVATIRWSNSPNSQSTTYLDINGNRVNQNSGDNSGSYTFKPSDYGVSQGSSYNVTVYRNGPYNGGTTVSSSTTLYTYTNPTLSNLTKTIPIINADQTETFSWVTNTPAWKSRNLENHILSMYINGNKITEINSGNEKNDITTIRVPNIGKYVNFDSSKLNGQTVDVKLVKSHANDSNVPEVSQTTQIIVRRIPTQYINKNSVVYRLVNSDGSIGITLPEDAIVDRKKNKGIQVSFSYPSNTSTEHYGIVHGYRITIFADNNANIFQKDYDSTSLNFNTIIDVNSLKWSSKNKIRIQAYYRHSDTNYNKSTNGQIYLGPYIEKTFPTVITRLDKPTINYPAQGSSWINNNYRILFQLPNDGDFNLYPDSISSNYIYRDIQVKITGGSTTVTYSWLNNPEIFSIDKTTYKAKVAINPSLISTHPIASSYTIQIRVRKNYGYPDATTYAEDSWSDWSDKRTFSIKSYSLFVNEGDYIMASHYKVMYDMISAMRNTYPTYNLKCKLVKRGDIILASDYDLVYQDIWSCYNTVNNWGKYGSTKNKVKFNQGNVIPSFNSNVGEFVTDLANDTKPVGRNYMIIMINDANLLK